MAYICNKPKDHCNKDCCPHCRWDEDEMRYCCFAQADKKAKYRTRFKDEEWNAIAEFTRATKLDTVFDLGADRTASGELYDFWWDYDNHCRMPLRQGLQEMWEGTAYPLQHDVSKKEAEIIVRVLKEFRIITDKQGEWLMEDEKEVSA